MLLIGPKMAGQIELKLGGMDEGIERTSSRRNFFLSVNFDWDQVGEPQVHHLGHGDRDPKLGM